MSSSPDNITVAAHNVLRREIQTWLEMHKIANRLREDGSKLSDDEEFLSDLHASLCKGHNVLARTEREAYAKMRE